jgi:hypothetical protein
MLHPAIPPRGLEPGVKVVEVVWFALDTWAVSAMLEKASEMLANKIFFNIYASSKKKPPI